MRCPTDHPTLESLHATTTELVMLGARRIADWAPFPSVRDPETTDCAVDLVGVGLRRPIDRRFRGARQLHGTEVIEAPDPVGAAALIRDGIAELLEAQFMPASTDGSPDRVRARVGVP